MGLRKGSKSIHAARVPRSSDDSSAGEAPPNRWDPRSTAPTPQRMFRLPRFDQLQSVVVQIAGTGLPLVGSGLDEEPTSVPQRFIPVGPENGLLVGSTAGSTCALVPRVRINPSTP